MKHHFILSSIIVLVFLCIGLMGCGNTEQKLSHDDPIERTLSVGGDAVYYNRLKQAETLYEQSLNYALARNDLSQINDVGYNLAVVQLQGNKPQQALTTINHIRKELYVRGKMSSEQLDLVEAGVLYRQHHLQQALALSRQAQQSEQKDIQERSSFLSGLIADQLDNMQQLQVFSQKLDQIIQLEKRKTPEIWKADQAELWARLAYRNGQYAEAIQKATIAETIRREQAEYRSMAQAVALKAKIEQGRGNQQLAATYFLQAGQSAVLLRDEGQARQWLRQAMSLQADQVTYELASAQLLKLNQKDRSSQLQ